MRDQCAYRRAYFGSICGENLSESISAKSRQQKNNVADKSRHGVAEAVPYVDGVAIYLPVAGINL